MLAAMAGLLVVAASALAIRMARQVEDRTAQQQQTQVRMHRIQAALHAFAASHGRLPCPADGMDVNDRGYAAPNAASDTCASPDGTVPWGSLGLTKDDAFDAWGRKISYRVYAGPTGMTRNRGADMTDCDTVEPAPVAPTPPSYDCTPAHNVRPGPGMGTYLDPDPNTRPGLTVRVGGIDQNQMAWVLVSHGASGHGAWMRGGGRFPVPASPGELANTQAPTIPPAPSVTFVQREENVVDLDPVSAPTHFDDLLLFETISQLVHAAGREARDWPEGGGPVTGDVIKKLLEDPNAIDTKGNGSGLTFIDLPTTDLGTVRISSTGGEISTDGPYKTLGVCSSGCGAGNSSNRALDSSESLSFRLGAGKTAKSFALGLLGISNATVTASITFKKNGVTLGNLIQSVVVTTAMPLSPQLTNLALTPPGTEFDEVVVQPVGTSRFFVANVVFCQASTCPSTGDVITGDVIKKLLANPTAIDTKVNGSGLTFIDLVTTDLGTVRISSTGGEISTDGPYKALGVCSSGCGAANSSNRALDSSESLSFRLGTGKTAEGFSLGLLGISNTTVAVSITFKRNGATLGNLIQSVAVNTSMPLSPQRTSLALTPPGTLFDEVVVQPVGSSRFFVANVFFCQMATCPSP